MWRIVRSFTPMIPNVLCSSSTLRPGQRAAFAFDLGNLGRRTTDRTVVNKPRTTIFLPGGDRNQSFLHIFYYLHLYTPTHTSHRSDEHPHLYTMDASTPTSSRSSSPSFSSQSSPTTPRIPDQIIVTFDGQTREVMRIVRDSDDERRPRPARTNSGFKRYYQKEDVEREEID